MRISCKSFWCIQNNPDWNGFWHSHRKIFQSRDIQQINKDKKAKKREIALRMACFKEQHRSIYNISTNIRIQKCEINRSSKASQIMALVLIFIIHLAIEKT